MNIYQRSQPGALPGFRPSMVSFRAGMSDEFLTYAIGNSEPWLRPALTAVRDHNCDSTIVVQRRGGLGFTLPTGRPQILTLGDDLDDTGAMGPMGFDAPSVCRFAVRSSLVVIVACSPLVELYELAANTAALRRRDVILVETRPEYEAAWYGCLRAVNPRIDVMFGSVRPKGGVN